MKVQLGRPLGGRHLKLDGVTIVEENSSGLIEVEYETSVNPRDVLTSFSSWEGVYVLPSRASSVDSAQREVFRLLYLTVFSAILTLPVLVLVWAPLPPHPAAYGAVSLAMTTIIQVVVARPIYVSGIRALLFQHTIDMDLLVSLSIGTAYVFSTVAYACMVAGRPIKDGESYFETAALLVTLVMLGRLIAAYARRRSTNAVSQLGSMQSNEATLVEKINGQAEARVIPIGLVHVGDILRIAPGELIPTDGRVVEGEGYVDESSITGESQPVIKTTERVLVAGTALVSNSALHMDMRVTVAPNNNTIARMAGLMRVAQSARLRVQDTTDRIASWLAPIALTIALVAFVGWTGVGVRAAYKLSNNEHSGEVQKAVVDAIGYTVAILVVSCPCALAICVPMVAVIAVAVGTRRGVLFKSVEALENACDVKVVVFDKTGTLTLGKLGVEGSTYYPQTDIAMAKSEHGIQELVRDLTSSSAHPVATAIHGNLSTLIPPAESAMIKDSDVRSIPGKGLEAALDGYLIRGGNAAWAAGDGVIPPASSDHTVFVVSVALDSTHPNFTRIAYYTLSDSLRPDSLKTVRELTNRGLEVHILSGDAPGVVTRTAAALGIPTSQTRGSCSPEEKAQWINRRKVMFIGDGTNDALALVQSDVSISMGSGTDIASSAANIVLLSSLSTGLSTVFTLARAARTRIWINFGWAFVYNVVAILMASGVLGSVRIPPEWAGLGELVSVLPVVLIAWSLGLVRW
ncbi:E1-E2 ATPase-domain-containing protein [Rhizoctonia solani]|nr:E1-E2 ATPase-domain-containing protein [Rhizoctonia solani]